MHTHTPCFNSGSEHIPPIHQVHPSSDPSRTFLLTSDIHDSIQSIISMIHLSITCFHYLQGLALPYKGFGFSGSSSLLFKLLL
mmetsp:Transcript_8567/g.11166  ORF Transcript_8567/g.11166 Transcript_8567/m.11166 type:complete len:83 (+) Transcript_8567:252-500(+)